MQTTTALLAPRFDGDAKQRSDRASQPVGEQLGEPCRILERSALSEKCCAVEQFGGLSDRSERSIVARLLRARPAGR